MVSNAEIDTEKKSEQSKNQFNQQVEEPLPYNAHGNAQGKLPNKNDSLGKNISSRVINLHGSGKLEEYAVATSSSDYKDPG